MAIRQIRQEGDSMLTKKSRPVKEITPTILALMDDMLETLRAHDGIGLAAPQIGSLKRIAIIENEGELYELINPEIVEQKGEQISNEACLSIPGRCGDISRPKKLTVRALNRSGEEITVNIDGLLVSAFCHEIDHLDGVLFTHKAINISLIDPDDGWDHTVRDVSEE